MSNFPARPEIYSTDQRRDSHAVVHAITRHKVKKNIDQCLRIGTMRHALNLLKRSEQQENYEKKIKLQKRNANLR